MNAHPVFPASWIAGCALVGPNAAMAADRYWNVSFGTASFFTPANWVDGGTLGIPGASDAAIFDIPGTFTVTFSDRHATDRAVVRRGVVTFDLGGTQYTLLNALSGTPSIAIALESETAWLTLRNGALTGQFTNLGQAGGSVGLMTIDGPDASLTNQWYLRVGNQGAAIMEVINGAQMTSGFGSVAQAAGSFGQLTIDGPGSHWICDSNLAIGKSGYGTLHIRSGAFVECGEAIVAQQVGSIGEVLVAGEGSGWIIHGTLDLGMHGPGTLTIEDGGSVETEGFAILSTFVGGPPWNIPGQAGLGKVTIRGSNSVWHVQDNLWVGLSWNAFLRIGRGGKLIVDGDLDVGPLAAPPEPDKLLTIELNASDNYLSPAIVVAGTCHGMAARIELVDGFVPSYADEFIIASAATLPAFAFTLPNLPNGLVWQTLPDSQTVRLRVLCGATGDLNDDGAVDVSDLLAVIGHWGPCAGTCPPIEQCVGDINNDCYVGVQDL